MMQDEGWRKVIDPTPAMIDAGVAFALNVSLGGEYRWSDYIADLWKTMDAARMREDPPKGDPNDG